MSESIDQLRKLTNNIFYPESVKGVKEITDKNGVKIAVIQVVDGKLNEVSALIKDAQNSLSLLNENREALLTISEGKDNRIVQLVNELNKSVADLKIANDKLDRIKA